MGIVVQLPNPRRPAPSPNPQQPPPFEKPSEDYAAKLRAFLDKKATYEHPLRLRQHSTWRKADLYLGNEQWLRKSYNLDSTRTVHWSRLEYRDDDPDAIPTPTYNEMISVHRNEAARLGRPGYKPYVRPEEKDPDAEIKAAAEKSAEILLAELERMHWKEQAELGYDHMPRYGGWALKSWWDVSWEKTTRQPMLSAMRCPAPGCGFTSASPDLDSDQALAVDQYKPGRLEVTQDPADVEKSKFALKSCLTCDDHEEMQEATETVSTLDENGAYVEMPQTMQQAVRVPGPPALEAFTPVEDELYAQDSLGRDLGQDVPVGEWKVRTKSPFDIFWANCGVDEDPQNWTEILDVHVESLDWVHARFPDKFGLVKPEAREALLKWHPIGGEKDIFFTGADGLFKNHVRVKEYHKKPYKEWDPKRGKCFMNKGRTIMMAGNVVLMDGPFLMESKNNPGKFIDRVHYDYAAFDIRDGGRSLNGVALTEYLFDVQDAINEAKSQTQDTRQRMASPKWLVKRGMNLDYATVGNAGAHWLYDDSPDGTPSKPEEVGSTTISEGVAREIERDIEFVSRVSNSQEIEDGNVPAGVTAAAAMQILAEQAGEQRKPRINRIREMLARVWKHGLQLCHEFVREERMYHKRSETDEWTMAAWTGMDIVDGCDVQIDPEPDHDTELQRQQNLLKAVEIGAVDVQENKRAAMLVAKALDIPSDLTEDDDIQYEAAEREYIDYLERDIEPVIDADLDDPIAHSDQHGQDTHDPRWRQVEAEAGWKEILKLISGWNDPVPGVVDPMTGQPTMSTMFEQIQSTPIGPNPLDPMGAPVTLGSQWPTLLELQIVECWKYLAQKYIQSVPEKQQVIQKVIRWRAHLAAHRMKVEENAGAAQMGAPVAAATGADATVTGTMPTRAGQVA